MRDFEVIDSYPFGVEFTWEKDGAPHTETLFKRAGPIPSSKMLTFFRYTCALYIVAICAATCGLALLFDATSHFVSALSAKNMLMNVNRSHSFQELTVSTHQWQATVQEN